jgi:HD-GYP domain-containing protein (c-di-GMP phosphodiesterase class II)
MTTERPYRSARRAQEALEELRRCAGSQFDPEVVEAVEKVLHRRFRPSARPGPPPEVASFERRQVDQGPASGSTT